MSFFKRLFNRPLREAHAAEASGDLATAAARFVEAESFDDVVRIHRIRAESERDPWTRIEILRVAHSFTDEHRNADVYRACCVSLADALQAWVEGAGVLDRRDKALMEEAASLYLDAGELELAGDAWVSIGYTKKAAEAYTSSGSVDKLERVFEQEETEQGTRQRSGRHLDDFRFAEQNGMFLEAMRHIDAAIEEAPSDPELRRLHARFHARVPSGGRLRLARLDGAGTAVLMSASPLRIGRDEHAELALLAPGVSRMHAQLVRQNGDVLVEDLGSRNGTRVDDVACLPTGSLGVVGELEIGDRCTLSYRRTEGAVVLEPQVATMRDTLFVWGGAWTGADSDGRLPDGLEVRLVDGFWHVAATPGLTIDGADCLQPTMLRYDVRLAIGDGPEIEVRR